VGIEHHWQYDHRSDDERNCADKPATRTLLLRECRVEQHGIRTVRGFLAKVIATFRAAAARLTARGFGIGTTPRWRSVFVAERKKSHESLNSRLVCRVGDSLDMKLPKGPISETIIRRCNSYAIARPRCSPNALRDIASKERPFEQFHSSINPDS
jgi:hypothetical protein